MGVLDDKTIHLFARVARGHRADAEAAGTDPSILLLAAASYGSRPQVEATIPTGFDLRAAKLFESIVEGAFLVATVDGVFDDAERRMFERIVATACGGTVPERHIADLVSELAEQLSNDGLEQRIARVASGVRRKEHAVEVLRIAALVAQVSEDVSEIERDLLVKLAIACGLAASEVDDALQLVRSELGAKA